MIFDSVIEGFTLHSNGIYTGMEEYIFPVILLANQVLHKWLSCSQNIGYVHLQLLIYSSYRTLSETICQIN